MLNDYSTALAVFVCLIVRKVSANFGCGESGITVAK